MSSYIDLVLCKSDDGLHLGEAPSFSYLELGDEVVLSSRPDEVMSVVGSLTIEKTSNVRGFIDMLYTDTMNEKPSKVLKKVQYREFLYEEGNDEQGDADRTDD